MLTSRAGIKNKIKADYKINDLYKYFKEQNPELADRVTEKIYKEHLDKYTTLVIKNLLDGWVIKLPYGLGDIGIFKKKMKVGKLLKRNQLKLDYKKYRETGKKVFHLNEHRNGYRYRVAWINKRKTLGRYRGLYKFDATRRITRTLSNILQTDFSKDYIDEGNYYVNRKI